MDDQKTYTINELVDMINTVRKEDFGAQGTDIVKRIREKIRVNGKDFWLCGYSNQEICDRYVDILEKEGLIQRIDPDDELPLLGDYLKNFYETYKTRQQKNTMVNRERIIRNHILPKFGNWRIDRITTTVIQKWFNELAEDYSKETILKIKNTLSPVLDSAVEDELINRNPLKSKRLENNGREVIHHKAIPRDKMREIKMELPELEPKMKWMGGLLSYTGMRYEEVLGCRFEDISKDGWLTICRAVVHPQRNMPVLKCTKTVTSDRIIPCPVALQDLFKDGPNKGFIMATDKDPTRETPMSYTEARRVFNKIQKRFGIFEYTPHDFRDTCATEWREKGMPLDVIARMLGHAKTETTERRYVKYRTDILESARSMM